MTIDNTYYKIAPAGRTVCLECPVPGGCVDGRDVDRYLCPLEPDLPSGQPDQWLRGIAPNGQALRAGQKQVEILGKIEKAVTSQPLTFSQIADLINERSISTIARWGRLGLLRTHIKHMPIIDVSGRKRRVRTRFVIGVNWDILSGKEIE